MCGAIIAGINLVILTVHYKDYSLLLPIMADNLNLNFIRAIITALGFSEAYF